MTAKLESLSQPEQGAHQGSEGGEVLLLLADISGYTRFMLSSRMALAHGQGIITALLKAIIRRAEVPIEVHKFEGDAVFLAAEPGEGRDWRETGEWVGRKLYQFVEAFDETLADLARSNACRCGACDNIQKLTLKVIAHKGKALRYRIGRFEELSGVDVIVLHRLLKNSVPGNRYILLTEAAFDFLNPGESFVAAAERYDDIGVIPVRYSLLRRRGGFPTSGGGFSSLKDHGRKMWYGLRYFFPRPR